MQEIIELLFQYSPGLILGAGIGIYLGKNFIPSYLKEKGKNLATKEDIEQLTHKIEGVKSFYSLIHEDVKKRNQLSFAQTERERNLKKEVLLEIIVAVSNCHSVITKFSRLDLTEIEITNILNEKAILSKAHVVCSERSLELIANFICDLQSCVNDLLILRHKINLSQSVLRNVQKHLENTQLRINNYLETIRYMTSNGSIAQQDMLKIDHLLKTEQDAYDTLLIDLKLKESEFTELYINLSNQCIKYHLETSKHIPDINLSIRQELMIDISEDKYKKIYEKMKLKEKNTYEKFVNSFENINSM